MKKIIFTSFLLIFISSVELLAEEVSEEVSELSDERTKLYFGLDVFSGKTNYDTSFRGIRPANIQGDDVNLDQDGFRLKFGAKLDERWRVQGYFQSEDVEDLSNNVYALGVDVIKGFEVAKNLELFLLGGVSVHWRELDEPAGVFYSEDYLSGSALKFGAGATYQLDKTFELVGGFDWQYRSWQDIDVVQIEGSNVYSYELRQDDISTNLYLGVNIHF